MTYSLLLPKWQSYRCLRRADLPPGLITWLLESGSLTQRLQQTFGNSFAVKVVCHRWQSPRYDDLSILDISSRQKVMVRETKLTSNDKVLIVARSVFPEQTLRGKGSCLRQLGSMPLGKILYNDPTLQRQPCEIARLRSNHLDYERAKQYLSAPVNALWARRSVFYLYGQPLLVSEIFLPNLWM